MEELNDAEKVIAVRKLIRNPFPDVNLTNDERQAIRLAVQGYTIREVSEALEIKASAAAFRITIGAAKVGVKKHLLPKAMLDRIWAVIG
jgi:DNA-binding CsgD family transcriptional regulator